VESNGVGDSKPKLLEDELMGDGGCVGMANKILSKGLLTPVVGCGKWDNAIACSFVF
jgi:hypothetical protein